MRIQINKEKLPSPIRSDIEIRRYLNTCGYGTAEKIDETHYSVSRLGFDVAAVSLPDLDVPAYGEIISMECGNKHIGKEDLANILLTDVPRITRVYEGRERLSDTELNIVGNVLGLSASALKEGVRKEQASDELILGTLAELKKTKEDLEQKLANALEQEKADKPKRTHLVETDHSTLHIYDPEGNDRTPGNREVAVSDDAGNILSVSGQGDEESLRVYDFEEEPETHKVHESGGLPDVPESGTPKRSGPRL